MFDQLVSMCVCVIFSTPVGSDMRFSSTTSTEPPSPVSGFLNTYFDSLMVLAGKDPEVGSIWAVVKPAYCQYGSYGRLPSS